MGVLDAIEIRRRKDKNNDYFVWEGRFNLTSFITMASDEYKKLPLAKRREINQRAEDEVKAAIYQMFLDMAVPELEAEVQEDVMLSRTAKKIFLVSPVTQSAEAFEIILTYKQAKGKNEEQPLQDESAVEVQRIEMGDFMERMRTK